MLKMRRIHMLSIRKILPIFLIPLLLVVFISPAEAQRRGGQRRATTRIQRKAPPMRSVQRSAPRQVRRGLLTRYKVRSLGAAFDAVMLRG